MISQTKQEAAPFKMPEFAAAEHEDSYPVEQETRWPAGRSPGFRPFRSNAFHGRCGTSSRPRRSL